MLKKSLPVILRAHHIFICRRLCGRGCVEKALLFYVESTSFKGSGGPIIEVAEIDCVNAMLYGYLRRLCAVYDIYTVFLEAV
jgi:hypothetical protein